MPLLPEADTALESNVDLEPYTSGILSHLSQLSHLHFAFTPPQLSPGEVAGANTTSYMDRRPDEPPQRQPNESKRTTSQTTSPTETTQSTHPPLPAFTLPPPPIQHPASYGGIGFPFDRLTPQTPIPASFQPASWPLPQSFQQMPVQQWSFPPQAGPSVDPSQIPHSQMGSEAFWLNVLGLPGAPIQTGSPLPVAAMQPSQPPVASSSAAVAQSPSPPAEDKRRRNTAASARFRIKKKQRMLNLERSVADLKGRAAELEKETGELRRENGWLREMVLLKGQAGGGGAPAAPSRSTVAVEGSSAGEKGKGEKGKGKERRKDPSDDEDADGDSDEDEDEDEEDEEEEEPPPRRRRRK